MESGWKRRKLLAEEEKNGILNLDMPHGPSSNEVPTNPRARRAWVIFKLHSAGSSFREIAEREGVSIQAVSDCMTQASARLEEAVARAIGLSVQQLFPERFNATGKRLFSTRPRGGERRKAGGL